MEFLELAKKRYAARTYRQQPVEPEKINAVLQAAYVAPTAANLQPHHIFVIQKPENLQKLSKAANIYHAPLVFLVCVEESAAWVRPFDRKNHGDIDASIITDHMMLEATEQGLNSVWICYFKPDVICSEFDLPQGCPPVNLLAVGYGAGPVPSPDRHHETRKPLETIVTWY